MRLRGRGAAVDGSPPPRVRVGLPAAREPRLHRPAVARPDADAEHGGRDDVDGSFVRPRNSGPPRSANRPPRPLSSLRTINERLQLIESRMGPEMPGSTRAVRPESPASASPLHQASDSDQFSPDSALDLGDGSNPVQMVVEEMSRIEARAGEMSLLDQAGARKVANPCDALLRGLVTVSEVELAFNLCVASASGW